MRNYNALFEQKMHIKVNTFLRLDYKPVCASSDASYVGQTCQYLTTRIDEHFGKDKKSHIYKQAMPFTDSLDKCSKDCFSVLDITNTKHQLRIKESLYITWLMPILNKQKHYQYIILSSFSFVIFPISFDFTMW